MKALMRVGLILTGIVLVFFPFILFFAAESQYRFATLTATFCILVLRQFLLATEDKKNGLQSVLCLLGIILVGVSLFTSSVFASFWYPVCVNICLFLLFCYSLLFGKPFVQSIAEVMEKKPLPQRVINYTRKVTIAWVVFFIFNGSISTITCLIGNPVYWTLYNGVVSYCLIGLFFAVEYCIRRRLGNA